MRRRPGPEPSELASLVERLDLLLAVRCGLLAVALVVAFLVRSPVTAPRRGLVIGSVAYLLALLAGRHLGGRSRRLARATLAATLLADGVALATIVYATGGTQSPLRALLIVHVAAVTVLVSARTGVKIAAWHTLLYLVTAYAQAAAIVPVREAVASSLPGGSGFGTATALQVGALWVAALATAACSRTNEGELRAQKADLAELSAMVRDLDARGEASEIPRVVLDALCRVFGFGRGVILDAPEGALRLAASRGVAAASPATPKTDTVVLRAWAERRSQLLTSFDPGSDPWLAALLPNARNVLVVPLLVEGDAGIGVVAVEWPAHRSTLKRWVVGILERYASHAALALHNAWLRDRLERQLEENRELQRRLSEHNRELEVRVQERTRDLGRSLEELRVADGHRRRLLAHLVHAEEEERRRIAGDVHDDPVQRMSAATMRIQVLRRSLSEPGQLALVDKVMTEVRGSIRSLRRLIFELRPHALDEEGLAPALREYLESLEAGFASHVDDRLRSKPPGEVGVVLYRMAQEALANVRKHARAHRVDVSLLERDGGFLLRIVDDGVGFDAPATPRSPPGHLGLTSLRERAEMAGGWCRLESRPGRGTTVEVWVPGRPATPDSTAPLAEYGETAAPVPDALVSR